MSMEQVEKLMNNSRSTLKHTGGRRTSKSSVS